MVYLAPPKHGKLGRFLDTFQGWPLDYIQYESGEWIAQITLNRPDRRNAQNEQFLNELDQAWDRAAKDADVRVIVGRDVLVLEVIHEESGPEPRPESGLNATR